MYWSAGRKPPPGRPPTTPVPHPGAPAPDCLRPDRKAAPFRSSCLPSLPRPFSLLPSPLCSLPAAQAEGISQEPADQGGGKQDIAGKRRRFQVGDERARLWHKGEDGNQQQDGSEDARYRRGDPFLPEQNADKDD